MILFDGLEKVSKIITPAKLVLDSDRGARVPAAGLILLDPRFRGDDDNGCFSTFYMRVKFQLSSFQF